MADDLFILTYPKVILANKIERTEYSLPCYKSKECE